MENEERIPENKFRTSDLGLATYLKIKGLIPDIKGKRGHRIFLFAKSEPQRLLVSEWYGNKDGFLNFYNSLRNLKSQVINMGD